MEEKKRRNPNYHPKDINTGRPIRYDNSGDKYIPPELRRYDALDMKLKNLGDMEYADYQKEQTLASIPKIELPEWAMNK